MRTPPKLILATAVALACLCSVLPITVNAQAPAPHERPAAPAAQQMQQPAAAPQNAENIKEETATIDATIASWKTDLDNIEKQLGQERLRYNQLDAFRDQIDVVRGKIDEVKGKLQPKLDEAKEQIEKLGPAPAQGQPPEPEAVAKLRASTNELVTALSASISAAEATRVRSDQLSSKIQDIRRRKFTDRLFDRIPGALSLTSWQAFPGKAVESFHRIRSLTKNWWANLDAKSDVIQIGLVSLAILFILTFAARQGVRQFRAWRAEEEPPFWRRASSAAWIIVLRALPAPAAVAFFYYSVGSLEVLPQELDRLLYAAMRSIIIVSAVSALITTVIAPNRPQWRIFPASDKAAIRIRWLVIALGSIYSLNLFLATLNRVAAASFSVTVLESFIASIAIALLVIAILRIRFSPLAIDGAPQLGLLGFLRLPLWGIALTILVTALTGYISLARFISAQLIVTGTILAVVYLLLVWVDAFGQSMTDGEATTGRWLQTNFGFEQRRREQLALPATLLLKFFVLLLSVPLIMLQWGFDWKDVSDWFGELLFGFRIGNTQISIAAIIAAVIVFILGYIAAKLFQGWLDRQVLAPAGISGSARDSIRTGVGYLGVFVAGLFAFSYAGFDLSNLAIVAGAFSVGIGFGLQSIVSNFVSGLILLAERPIKVGDWVVVGGEEGIVRRISVRSTEIETFEKANVIVPNSYLISEKVKNWTLHNNTGRIVIPIAVGADADPQAVCDLLVTIARQHQKVMRTPEPFVSFEDFGPSALNFKLYVYLYDLTQANSVRNEIRMGILKAMREIGILIPAPSSGIPAESVDVLVKAFAEHVARNSVNHGEAAVTGGNGMKTAT